MDRATSAASQIPRPTPSIHTMWEEVEEGQRQQWWLRVDSNCPRTPTARAKLPLVNSRSHLYQSKVVELVALGEEVTTCEKHKAVPPVK